MNIRFALVLFLVCGLVGIFLLFHTTITIGESANTLKSQIPQIPTKIVYQVVNDVIRAKNATIPPIQAIKPAFLSKTEISDYISKIAEENGVNPQVAVWIAKKESNFNQYATGDNSESAGIWQIHMESHPELTSTFAFDIVSSTLWSINQMKMGNYNIWSVYKFCRLWYSDCPLK